MHLKSTTLSLSFLLTLASANPALPVSAPALPVSAPAVPVSAPTVPVSLGVPAPATAVINSIAGTTGLPILSSLPPISGVSVPSSLPTAPVSGLTTDPTTLANNLSETIQILELVLNILTQIGSNGSVAVPGASSLGLGVEGSLLVALLALAKGMIPLA